MNTSGSGLTTRQWWTVAAVGSLVGIAAVLLVALIHKAKTRRVEWLGNANVLADITRLELELRRSIESAGTVAPQFTTLIALHGQSVQLADTTYGLFEAARESLQELNATLQLTKIEKRRLTGQLDALKHQANGNSARQRRSQTLAEVRALNTLRDMLFEDKNSITQEKNSLLVKVRALNAQTHELKLIIRDRCGSQGRTWYERKQRRSRR